MTRKIASRSAAIALFALGALTNVALAEPVKLTDGQMDQVNAGAFTYDSAGNLYDTFLIQYTYDADSGRYRDATGAVWDPGVGAIYYAEDGFAYGWLVSGGGDVIWDGGINTFEHLEPK